MTDKNRLTVHEISELNTLSGALRKLLGTELTEQDFERVKEYLTQALDTPAMARDVFGLHPMVTDLETAQIIATEISLSRAAILGVMLNRLVIANLLTLEQIEEEFGPDVRTIIHGLARINELYEKNPIIESENFRQLLL